MLHFCIKPGSTNIELNDFVVMPNHFTGIIQIFSMHTVGTDLRVFPDNADEHKKGKHTGSSLHKMIQWLKTE